jgi:hypothetical protein
MPTPRVFVSSTCYDLHYIRDSLEMFIRTMGFEPVLSERGHVYYNPSMHVQDSLLDEVAKCQMFVLVIGGRFGSKFKGSEESVVNHEYRKAIDSRIPVFAVVESAVYSGFKVYLKNMENRNVDRSKIIYSDVDSCKIFDFMQEVESKAYNNALFSFSNVSELESYLRQQWAGLMFNLLTQKTAYERETEIFETLSHVEFLSKQILNSFGQNIDKINSVLYEKLSKSELGKIERNMRLKISVIDLLESNSAMELLDKKGITVNKHAEEVELIPQEGFAATVPLSYFNSLQPDFDKTKKDMLSTLDYYGWDKDSFLGKTKVPKIGKKNQDKD